MHEPFGSLADVVGHILARRWRQREEPSTPTFRKSKGRSRSSNETGRSKARRSPPPREPELPPE